MNDPLFPSAAPDFNDPIGLLEACHGRILHHCETLEKLVAHLREHGADSEARKAAGQVHRYFSTAGRHHHEDEEKDLFPFLARQSLKLAEIVHRLRQDHERMDELWRQLAPRLETIGREQDLEGLEQLVAAFCAAYRDHIGRENEELLEMARHILSSEQQQKLGSAMAVRRGQRPLY